MNIMARFSGIQYPCQIVMVLLVGFIHGNSGQAAEDILTTEVPRTAVEPGILISHPKLIHPTYHLKLEIFIDLNCPDSWSAFVNVTEPLADYYSRDNRVVIIARMYPLPYHRNSMLSTQGAYAVMQYNPKTVVSYMEALWAEWEQLLTDNTRNMTEYDVLRFIEDIAVASTGISHQDFRAHIDLYKNHVTKIWKYGAKRGVAATPTYFFNGIEMNVADNSKLALDKNLWIKYIDTALGDMNDIINN